MGDGDGSKFTWERCVTGCLSGTCCPACQGSKETLGPLEEIHQSII